MGLKAAYGKGSECPILLIHLWFAATMNRRLAELEKSEKDEKTKSSQEIQRLRSDLSIITQTLDDTLGMGQR